MSSTPESVAADLFNRYGSDALAIAQTHLDEARQAGDERMARQWIAACDEIRRLHADEDTVEIDLDR
ncbi:hypothetical protein AA13595_1993 [Gluconacetobacter johannae DSM 13595]|uniref:Uncharacterized protein n=1 Tax=Gluconacetobacter johannae TaxID=112140 RepID=A0A7W4P2G7_9PROT|nr:hypothetical protein [Gluconacetobacter johannae]MBB2175151.1 hypothetical protein [Gluconacetobacter johannae]GBQ86818.1 hypothetical protein AA13595_1993 [Gluconacetobacter johannae DSM 13595]